MNFKKIAKPASSRTEKTYTVDDLKMVKVSVTFPVWKTASFEDICQEFNDSVNINDTGVIEESAITVSDLENWVKNYKSEDSDGEWYFYHRDMDITADDIIRNSKSKPKRKSK